MSLLSVCVQASRIVDFLGAFLSAGTDCVPSRTDALFVWFLLCSGKGGLVLGLRSRRGSGFFLSWGDCWGLITGGWGRGWMTGALDFDRLLAIFLVRSSLINIRIRIKLLTLNPFLKLRQNFLNFLVGEVILARTIVRATLLSTLTCKY